MRKLSLNLCVIALASLLSSGCTLTASHRISDGTGTMDQSENLSIATADYQRGLSIIDDPANLNSSTKLKEAIFWITHAANRGLPIAEFKLGVIYFRGIGVPANQNKGAYWIAKAAHDDYPFAKYMLGYLYQKGIGVAQNDLKAKKWFHAAKRDGIEFPFGRGIKITSAMLNTEEA